MRARALAGGRLGEEQILRVDSAGSSFVFDRFSSAQYLSASLARPGSARLGSA